MPQAYHLPNNSSLSLPSTVQFPKPHIWLFYFLPFLNLLHIRELSLSSSSVILEVNFSCLMAEMNGVVLFYVFLPQSFFSRDVNTIVAKMLKQKKGGLLSERTR